MRADISQIPSELRKPKTYFSMIEITLEDEEIRSSEVEEKIRSFVLEIPEGVSTDPAVRR